MYKHIKAKKNIFIYSRVFLKSIKKMLVVLIIIFGCSFLIYSREPNPDIPQHIPVVTQKLEYFAKHKDEYNLIFLGSSRTYQQIMPSVFDKSMLDSGYSIKSFNMGMTALKIPEFYFYLQKILKLNPANLQWIFFEFIDDLNVPYENLNTTRVIAWHTPKQTLWTCQKILKIDLNPLKKIEYIHNNIIPLLYNLLNAGKAANLIRDFIGFPEKIALDKVSPIGPLKDGHVPSESLEGRVKRRIEVFLKNLDNYQKSLDYLKNINSQPLTESQELILEEIITLIKNSGYTPVLLKPPSISAEAYLIREIPQKNLQVFKFNDPIKFPKFYEINTRFDSDHMTHKGSQIYTKLLAKKFASYLEEQNGEF